MPVLVRRRPRLCLILAASIAPVVLTATAPNARADEPGKTTDAAAAAAPNASISLDSANTAAITSDSDNSIQPGGQPAASDRTAGTTAASSGDATQDETGSQVLPPMLGGHGTDSRGGRQRTSLPWYRNGLVSLAVVLGVIVAVAALARRLIPSVRASSSALIEVVGRSHLAPKQSLALVRVGRRLLVVGLTAERVSTLCQIDEPGEVAELLAGERRSHGTGRRETPNPRDKRFADLLGAAARDYEPQIGTEAATGEEAESIVAGIADHAENAVAGNLARAEEAAAVNAETVPMGTVPLRPARAWPTDAPAPDARERLRRAHDEVRGLVSRLRTLRASPGATASRESHASEACPGPRGTSE